MNIPYDELSIQILTNEHNLSSFTCGDEDLDDFLINDAFKNQLIRFSVTRVVFHHNYLVGFFTLTTDCINKEDFIKRDQIQEISYRKYPALKIARLATASSFQRKGVGEIMLGKIFEIAVNISKYIGCRIITVDSKPGTIDFYRKYGFKTAKNDQNIIRLTYISMYIDYFNAIEISKIDHTLKEYDQNISKK